ncbi:hypothetical protein PMAYCL1PPCAC_19477, partial [Pristionchus mayeri]
GGSYIKTGGCSYRDEIPSGSKEMLPLPAFALLAAMTAPITQSQILPVFDLKKFWDAYLALLQNPNAAFSNPTKAWNDMMGAWVVPGGGSTGNTKGDEPKPAEKPAARQGTVPIDISPEAALALAVFRREHQLHGDNGATADRSPSSGVFYRPQASPPDESRPFANGLPTSFGGRGFYSPYLSHPYFVALPVRTTSNNDADDSSEDSRESAGQKTSPLVGPGPSQAYSPPFGGQSTLPFIVQPHAIYQGFRPPSYQNIIVHQGGEGLNNGGAYGGSKSISVIQ